MAIARAYGMIRLGAASSATVRATFVIDPGGIVRAIIWYPMTTGRSVEEILRLLAALQMADASNVSTPEGWKPGELTIEPAPVTVEEAERQAAEDGSMDWYYRLNGR
jgi:peroxiredoxin (alkyl hydroperoxide reductase subunit C)